MTTAAVERLARAQTPRLPLPTNLKVGGIDDPLEHEADQVADRVMRMPTPDRAPLQRCPGGCPGNEVVRRKALPMATGQLADGGAHAGGAARRGVNTGSVINDSNGEGASLPSSTRRSFEPRFGVRFDRVRVHVGGDATGLAQSINARAFTVANDIVFAAGQYRPGTAVGDRLIAHELTHVLQQSGIRHPGELGLHAAGPSVMRKADVQPLPPVKDDPEELQTDVTQSPGQAPLNPEQAPLNPEQAPLNPEQAPLNPEQAPLDPEQIPQPEPPRPEPTTVVYSLTFDDGPHHTRLGKGINNTETVLNTLSSRGAKAGFFIQSAVDIRGASESGRALVTRMAVEGHTVGVHTGGSKDHEPHPLAEKEGRLEGELRQGKRYIWKRTGKVPEYVRPPYGMYDKDVTATYKKTGLTMLKWDIDGDKGASSLKALETQFARWMPLFIALGWRGATPVAPKIVILYHDLRGSTANNIGGVIDYITKYTKNSGKAAKFEAP